MRRGVRDHIGHLARTSGALAHQAAPTALLAALAAGAFTPLLMTDSGLLVTSLGAMTAVGGNVLTDILKAGINKLRRQPDPHRDDVRQELEFQIKKALEAGGATSDQLRADLAATLRSIEATAVATEAAVRSGDHEIQRWLITGLAILGEQYDEFSYVIPDLRVQLGRLQESLDGQSSQLRQQSAELQVAVGLGYRQATDIRLILEHVATIEQRTRSATAAGPADVRWQEPPYRGLLPFREIDSKIFYGRENLAAQLLSAIAQQPSNSGILLVTGPSGSGKSSLIQAGLFAAVARGELSESARHWPRHVINAPSATSLEQLATLLAGLAQLDASSVLGVLARRPDDAHLLVRQAVDEHMRRHGLASSSSARLLLVIDQFEQIFDSGVDDLQRACMISALHAAATKPSGVDNLPAALIVLCVRGDYIDRCAEYNPLAEALQKGAFVVGPISATDLRRAITGPADSAGLQVEPGLVDAILSELRGSSGAFDAGSLPLVSQTMLTIWEHREGIHLTSRGLAKTGGVTRALATNAEGAYADLPPDHQDLARRVFQQLSAVTSSGQLTRRPSTRDFLRALGEGEAVDRIIDKFAKRRLIIVDADHVQIAHDILLSVWPRLNNWLEADLGQHVARGQIMRDAEEWITQARASSFLYRGDRLRAALSNRHTWKTDAARYSAPPAPVDEFLDAGKRTEIRATRRRRSALAVLIISLILVTTTAVIAVRAQQTATIQRDLVLSRQLAAKSQILVTDPPTSALLAVAAWRIAPTNEANANLRGLLTRPDRGIVLDGSDANGVTFSPDGRYLATVPLSTDDHVVGFGFGFASKSFGNPVIVWDLKTRHRLGDPFFGRVRTLDYPPILGLNSESFGASTVEFSHDGRTIAISDGEDSIQLWDVASHRPIGSALGLLDDDHMVTDAAFNADGSVLATIADNAIVQLWNTRTYEHIATLGKEHIDDVAGSETVTFSPAGENVAIGDGAGVRIWNVVTKKPVTRPLPGATGAIEFSPDGGTIAGEAGIGLQLYDAYKGTPIGEAIDKTYPPMAFSPDGEILAATYGEKIRLWDTHSQEQLGEPLIGHTTNVGALRWDATEGMLTSSGFDGSVRSWDTRVHRQMSSPVISTQNHTNWSLDFSLDRRRFVIGYLENTAQIYGIDSGETIGKSFVVPMNPDDPRSKDNYGIGAVAFSPDNTILATGDDATNIRLWDIATRRPLGSPLERSGNYGAGAVTSLAFSSDGSVLAASDQSNAAHLWDPRTRRPIGNALVHARAEQVHTVVFSPDGEVLVTAADDGTVRLWSVRNQREITGPLTGFAGDVEAVAFSPDGRTLVTGGEDGKIRLWDVITGRQLGSPLSGHTSWINSVSVSPDGTRIVSASNDATIRLWDFSTGQQLGLPMSDHSGNTYGVAFLDNSTLIGLDQSSVRRWDVSEPDKLVATACAIAGHSLSLAQWKEYVPENRDPPPTC